MRTVTGSRPCARQGRRIAAAAASAMLLAVAARPQTPAMELPTVDLATVITDKRGAVVSGELTFVDESGRTVRLAEYFGRGRPIVLNLGYYGCPALCGAVLQGLVEALRELPLEIGKDFEVLTVSIDPSETPELARAKKATYLAEYGAPGAEQGWHFLTGDEPAIRELAATVGFGYQWNPFGKQWDHSAGLMILAPDGALTQVMQGALYSSRALRLLLVEASDGTIGSTWDKILLTCYGYDPATSSYNLMVWTVIRVGGGLTVLGIAALIFVLWRRERRGVAVAT